MESAADAKASTKATLKSQINALELPSLLDQYPNINTLSLDCFDTILWRRTATPIDLFYDIQQLPEFKSLGFSARLRAQAEISARQRVLLTEGNTEVNLKNIYLASFPNLTNQQVEALEEAELAAEINACYAFPPIVELMRQAKARGLKMIIVSDTYFTSTQLKRLLSSCLPKDVMEAISKIYCSSEHGASKSGGLFNQILEKQNKIAQEFLHIGDHLLADYVSAQAIGLNAVQLIHHDKRMNEIFRLQSLSGGFLDPTIRHSHSLCSPFRGVFAAADFSFDKPESAIGYASIGPIMYAFSRFICNEVKALRKKTSNVKVLFLLRDAYLPSLACEALLGEEAGKCVRISRFAAYASSFRNQEDVYRYLSENVGSFRFYDIAKQLLLPEDIRNSILENIKAEQNPIGSFLRQICQPDILKIIYKESKYYRSRMMKHLEKEVGIKRGDTLVFVDLGYTGTAQVKLEPVFREEYGINIVGRYLIALSTPNWQTSRRGLLDPSWCDERSMHMLVTYIALLEQICTSNERSVVDYDDEGNPIFTDTTVSKQQHGKLEPIQKECIRFVRDAKKFFDDSAAKISDETFREAALTELSRLLFLPTAIELQYLKTFQFDLNLGTKDLLNVFDQDKGLTELRRRGLFFMEKNLKSMRTNYPAELRSAGLELVLMLMAQHRIDFDVRVNDLSLRRENINIIVLKGGRASQTFVQANPTYDGYFSLLVPVGAGEFQIGIQFGLPYSWVQIESSELVLSSALYSSQESQHTIDATKNLVVDQMVEKGVGLYECLSETSLMMYVPNHNLSGDNYTLRIVFRPIVVRNKTKYS